MPDLRADPSDWHLCPRSLANRAVRYLPSPGKPRPLRWPCGSPRKATSPGRSGRPRSPMNSSPRPIVASRTTAPRYYEHWLAALERLVTAKALSNPSEMLARKEAWADAYRHTPHGKPVALRKNATAVDDVE